ncbi:MAG: hypothetical protein ACI8ZN_000391 [Bacteroidia bacterium]|jgi:hypothetical protein
MNAENLIISLLTPNFNFSVWEVSYTLKNTEYRQVNDFLNMGFVFPFILKKRKITLLENTIHDPMWSIPDQKRQINKLFKYNFNEIRRIASYEGIDNNKVQRLLNITERDISGKPFYYKSDERLEETDRQLEIAVLATFDYKSASDQLKLDVVSTEKLLSPYFYGLKTFIQEVREILVVIEAPNSSLLHNQSPNVKSSKKQGTSSDKSSALWGVDRIEKFELKKPKFISLMKTTLVEDYLSSEDLSTFCDMLHSIKCSGTITWKGNQRTLNALFTGVSSIPTSGTKYTQVRRQFEGKIILEGATKPVDLSSIRDNKNESDKEPYKQIRLLGVKMLDIINS